MAHTARVESGRALMAALALANAVRADELPIPPRLPDAIPGSVLAQRCAGLDLADREREILGQLSAGNVPDFWRRFIPVEIRGAAHSATFRVAPEYLAVGSDEDYVLVPLSPMTAHVIAQRWQCGLPTPKLVDAVFATASVKLTPSPMPPSPAMTTWAAFVEHSEIVHRQRTAVLAEHPLGELVAGHEKDVVWDARLTNNPGKVAIYGWHKPDGMPIQPLYLGHASSWVDYSHGIRLVRRSVTVDGMETGFDELLKNSALSELIGNPATARPSLPDSFGEQNVTLAFDPGVRVVINRSAGFDSGKAVRLVLYALPNGNTIEQTIGRAVQPGDDFHFDIQHIAAQTRWLRQHLLDANFVVAYLECAERSWPAWRKKHDLDDQRIPRLVDVLRGNFPGQPITITLTGHSGGGSFTFGYLNGVGQIPDDIERIAFLDSNYGYDANKGHQAKFSAWLTGSRHPHLCVLAYHDSIALLNGKTFVSEVGGTWGRSLAMQMDLAKTLAFQSDTDGDWQRFTALDGRVKFLLRENPTKAVLHTRLVEFNGFIHAMLTGADHENRDYENFGPRAYGEWIAPAVSD